MNVKPIFGSRHLRVTYWNAEVRVVAAERLALEQHLRRLGDVTLVMARTLEGGDAFPCDLLIVAGQMVPEEEFGRWLAGLRRKVVGLGSIWTPTLILSDVSFGKLADILADAIKDNWYFDILAPAHLDSLPIRVANLLRIHDHLHELKRYEAALAEINGKVKDLEAKVAAMSAGPDAGGGH